MKILDLAFRNDKGATRHLKLRNVTSELDESTVKNAMQTISTLNLFADNKTHSILYSETISASYIETSEKVIFKPAQ